VLARFGLKPHEYLLYVSRFEPENNALGVVQAYRRSGVTLPLVMVGDAPYAKEYIQAVHQAAGPGVIFTGYQFGAAYQELQSNAYLYIQATEVGGTHPALVEAMAYGNAIVANDTPEHREVLGDAGWYYPKNDFERLSQQLADLVCDSAALVRMGESAAQRAAASFSWEEVATQYEKLFSEMIDRWHGPRKWREYFL
jgi:glycosyltransferase involved in cell wall biosynthesis